MSNKVIIVGATSGMGKRIAELYAEKGWSVGITGRRQDLLDELKNRYPTQVESECFDITKNENTERLQALIQKLGGLDLLIISAGGGDTSDDLRWELDKWMVDINVNGFVQIANWTFNYFIKQGYGHMAVISSIAAYRGNSQAPAYSASKAFQSIYFEGLALKARRARISKKNITVTCIEPGFVDTKMAKSKKLFWVVPVDKAARQIIQGIERKKRKVYISRRWRIVAWIMKWIPYGIYKRIA
jgi:short-subunit dehydrogenase